MITSFSTLLPTFGFFSTIVATVSGLYGDVASRTTSPCKDIWCKLHQRYPTEVIDQPYFDHTENEEIIKK